jgi:glycosyltransferase involved in cell wall biosynthesis
VRRHVAADAFDLVHLQLARVGELVAACGATPVVIDFVDALSDNMRRRADAERGPARLLFAMEARRLQRYERVLAATATASVISAARDAAVIGGQAPPRAVANGIDLDRMPHAADQSRRAGVVFIGNWGYFPNRHGLRWLLDRVWPSVRDAVPDARLELIGRDTDAIRFAEGCPGVRVLGAVESVVPALHGAAVAVAPLHVGTGQSLKVIEAMACGAAVVTTSAVADALGAGAGDVVEIADEAPAYAAAIIRLLRDPQRRRDLSAAARMMVEHSHDWENAAARLNEVWRDAVAGRRFSDPAPPAAVESR